MFQCFLRLQNCSWDFKTLIQAEQVVGLIYNYVVASRMTKSTPSCKSGSKIQGFIVQFWPSICQREGQNWSKGFIDQIFIDLHEGHWDTNSLVFVVGS